MKKLFALSTLTLTVLAMSVTAFAAPTPCPVHPEGGCANNESCQVSSSVCAEGGQRGSSYYRESPRYGSTSTPSNGGGRGCCRN